MTVPEAYTEAINVSDHAELLRWVDRFDSDHDDERLVQLAWACHRALDRGHQLGAITAHAAYRLALHAPVAAFAEVLDIADDRFTPGPFAEVLASSHSSGEIGHDLPFGAVRSLALAECVLRGDVVDDDETHLFDTPGRLADWEPEYALASYSDTDLDAGTYEAVSANTSAVRLPPMDSVEVLRNDDAVHALHSVVAHWAEQSTGRIDTSVVAGDASHAICALGVRSGTISEISVGDAFGLLGWAGATGAAHAKRRGAAAGRFAAWWAAAALTDTPWPTTADTLGGAGETLQWFTFDAGLPALGWQFRLAVTDAARNRSWAITADDME